MNSKTKKLLMGSLTLGTIIAPVATLVACDSTTTNTTDVTSDDNAKVFKNADGTEDTLKISDLKAQLNKQTDAATASSNFISQVKYELTESLYKKEYEASFEYQKGFLRWNIFTAQKDQLALAKEIAALYKDDTTTSTQISVDLNAASPVITIKDALGIPFANGYKSDELFDFINNLAKDSTKATNADRKTTFNSKLETFKNHFKDINNLKDKLKNIDNLKDDSNSGWDNVSSDYPKLLKSIAKITETETKTYNEAKAAFIDQYRTAGGGAEEWTKERSSKYNGASTDAEAIKYLVNQQIQSTAFGQFTYSLNDTFTIEQALATYDDNGTIEHIFPWFKGYNGATDKTSATIGDKNWKTRTGEFKLWTNSIDEFKTKAGVASNLHIDTDNVTDLFADAKESAAVITPLLNNKVFFLNRNTKITDQMIVDLKGQTELTHAPILITHSLIKATQDKTSSSLPWTIDKDAIKNLLEYFGASSVANAKQGIDLFSTLYLDTNKTQTDLYNKYVSDDTGSRANNGELGVQTYQWYARQGGMNDGFALATMVAYSNMKNVPGQAAVYDLKNSIQQITPTTANDDGEDIIASLKTKLIDLLPANLKTPTANNANATTAATNTAIAAWVDSLTDADLKSKFGTIFADLFNNRKVVYALEKNSGQTVTSRYLLASPDSGVHIINITNDSSDWFVKYQVDMQLVAQENAIGKAKVDWAKLYSDYFTEDEIISNLLKNKDYKDLIVNLPTTNSTLVGEWVKAGYVGSDAQTNGQKIIDKINEGIQATRINNDSTNSRNALTGRIGTYLIGQMDSKYIDSTIEPTSLYTELLKSLIK